MTGTPADAILLDGRDNVALALRDLARGEPVRVKVPGEMIETRVRDPIPRYHKFAMGDLAAGDLVFKFGHEIGAVTCAVPSGGHVHVHNLRSLRARSARG